MKLWLLRAIEGLSENDDPWNRYLDFAFGFVVRAETEEQARNLITDVPYGACDEGVEVWKNPKYTTCVELPVDGQSEVIMRDSVSAT